VDLSVADEAGIYHLLDKQSICSYYEPECVIVDIDTLETLPGKELLSGIVETIKLSLVRDGNFLQWLKTNMTQLLERYDIPSK
jgi:3-dehydroquinate synthase